MKLFSYKYSKIILAGLLSSWGFYLRWLRLLNRNHVSDEFTIIHNTAGSLQPFWQRLTYGELTSFPGLYITVYPFMKIFGDCKWGLAIPHIISTILGFYFLYLICRKYCKTVFGFIVPFVFVAFNDSLIYHSFELRPYAVLPTLALGCFYFSEIIVNRAASLSALKKILIGFFFVFVVLYHAYGIMIAFVCLLYFLIAERKNYSIKKAIKNNFLFLLIFGIISMGIFLWYASGTTVNYEHTQGRNINTFDYIPNPLIEGKRFFRSIFSNMLGFKRFNAHFLIFGLFLSFLLPHKEKWKQVGFFLVIIILPLELMLLTNLHSGYWFLQRQFVWQMPLFAFLLGWSWDAIITTTTDFLKSKKIGNKL